MQRPAEVSRAYLRIVLRSGVAPADELLAGTALTEEALKTQDFVPAQALAIALRNYRRYTTSSAWTAELGAMFNIASHGPMGFAALSAPTLGDALDVIATLYPSRITAIETRRVTSATHEIMQMHNTTADDEFGQWLAEIIMKISEAVLEAILGHRVGKNVKISFAHPAPPDAAALMAAYDADVSFGQPVTSFAIPLAWHQLPSPLHDEAAYRSNLVKCRELIAAREQSGSTAAIVRNHLLRHFDSQMLQSDTAAAPPTLERMADTLATTPRTLIRRLEREECTYRSLLEELRRDYAETLLRDARLNIADVAQILGYREPANFGRAFKRWYGVSPAAWRKGRK